MGIFNVRASPQLKKKKKIRVRGLFLPMISNLSSQLDFILPFKIIFELDPTFKENVEACLLY